MIEQMFIRVLNMSLTASAVIAAVLLLRLLLKKAPKIFSYWLWAAVLFRLLCPVSFTAVFSLFSMLQTPSVSQGMLEYIPERQIFREQQPDLPPSIAEQAQNQEADPARVHTALTKAAGLSRTEMLTKTAAAIWLLGIIVMIFFNLVNLLRLQQSLKTAAWNKDNIYITQKASTPFVIGIIRPRIYLPSHLGEEEKEYVLLHEQIHIKRKDHLVRLISYLALCLHWFNPLAWTAFFLSGKDMEMSCDEAVIRKIGTGVKKEYSCSLLSMAAGRPVISGIPLAFGEGDTKSRIKNILHYKKPASIVVKSTALLCTAAVVILLANPVTDADAESSRDSSEIRSFAQNKTPSQDAVQNKASNQNAVQNKASNQDAAQNKASNQDAAQNKASNQVTANNQGHLQKQNDEKEQNIARNQDSAETLEPSSETSASELRTAGAETKTQDSIAGAETKTQDSITGAEAKTQDSIAGTEAKTQDSTANPENLYQINVRSISKSARTIDSYIPPLDFPFEEGEPLVFADDCQFLVNCSMNSCDYREVSFNLFATLIEKGGDYLNKPCLLGLENGRIVSAVMESAWDHYGICPLPYPPYASFYDSVIESEGEDAFHNKYSLASSETMDIADSKGYETIEVYTENSSNVSRGIVVFKDADGLVLFTQDAGISRAGWNNIYLGSDGEDSFILTVHIEDRWNYGQFSYQVFRLDKDGSPVIAASSAFDFQLGGYSNLVYDDNIFQKWITPLENYLKNSRLVLSSQDQEVRTEKISEADKYNYHTLSLKDRALKMSASDDSIIRFQDSWYGKYSLKPETVEWLLWYNSLSETEQLSVSSVSPELTEAKYLIGAGTQDAAAD